MDSNGIIMEIITLHHLPPRSPRRGVLESCVDQVVTARVPTLERIGGGSVRCMVAELFKRRGASEDGGERRWEPLKVLTRVSQLVGS